MRFRQALFFSIIGALAACATAPRTTTSIPTSLVVWPRSSADCDYEHPDRDNAWAVSTSHEVTSRITSRIPRRQSSHVYVVRNAQVLSRPAPDQILCVAVVRFVPFNENLSVFGFEMTIVEQDRLQLRSRYARVQSSALADPTATAVDVNVVVGAAGLDARGVMRAPSIARFDLGEIPTSGVVVNGVGAHGSLSWSQHDPRLKMVAVITETRPGDVPLLVSDARVAQTLAETDVWTGRTDHPRSR